MNCKAIKYGVLALMLLSAMPVRAQKLIEYEAGMGTRDKDNAEVWILYQRVKAVHEGMFLYADSAKLNTRQNDFTAFRNIKIVLTDTTVIYGDRLYYDGQRRIVNIWADTVVFVDGATVLKTPQLTYDRNTNIATYTTWGHTTNKDRRLDSRSGQYNSDTKVFFIHDNVELQDPDSRLVTDTLYYNMNTDVATFISPTHIYSDSSVLYSENGFYNTDTRYAVSYKASQVVNKEKLLKADTLYYYETSEFGKAYGHVMIEDTLNQITCTGRYGESCPQQHYSYVTDSALVIFVDKGDSLFLHADTVWVANDSARQMESVRAHRHVKVFRADAQAMCDSVYYSAPDSSATLFGKPVLWYDYYQCTSDTLWVYHDSTGMKMARLEGSCFTIEQVDDLRFNQVKGKRGEVYFTAGEPDYADVIGNAQMSYYITDEDSTRSLIGANAGVGSRMRIYFQDKKPHRMVTFGNPDMKTYPPNQLPEEWRRLTDFQWLDARRPKNRHEVFEW